MACVEKQNCGSNAHFRSVERVHGYPIVSDSLLLAVNCYQWAKSKNAILDGTLSMLEGTLKTVKDKTEPIAADKLQYFDEGLSRQLERLERLCPILLQPSRTLVEVPAAILRARVEPSLWMVAKPVAQTLGLVSRTTCAMASTMSSTLTLVVPTGMLPIKTTKSMLSKTEKLLDAYFPEKDHSYCYESKGEADHDEHDDVVSRIKRLSKKTKSRIQRKILDEIEYFKIVSLEKLEQIYAVIEEIRISKDKVHDIREKIRYNQLISDGLRYSDSLQQFVRSTAHAMPRLMCTNMIFLLDLINEKLFFVRNTIQESSNSKIMSEKRIRQAAEVIDLVRSWIEYLAAMISDYNDKEAKEEPEGSESVKEVDDDPGSSSVNCSSCDEDAGNSGE